MTQMTHTREWKKGDETMVFIPFPRANSQEALDSTLGRKVTTPFGEMTEEEGWNPFKADAFGRILGIKFSAEDVFCADDQDRVKKLEQLKSERDMLYLRGHCSAGSSMLTSPDRKVHVNEDQILALLEGALAKDFKGIIKVYSCHSGSDWCVVWQSFAQRLANVMYDAGYKKCSFYGYTAKLSTWAEKKDLIGKQRKLAADDSKTIIGLASSRRIEITPANKFSWSV